MALYIFTHKVVEINDFIGSHSLKANATRFLTYKSHAICPTHAVQSSTSSAIN